MRLTWWGHSTATVTDGGMTVLTDPVLRSRVAHLYRRAGENPPDEVAHAEVVVVSHLHMDHFDVPSLKRIDPGATLIVPHGGRGVLRHQARGLAKRAIEVAPGDRIQVGHLAVTATAAEHPGVRGPWSRFGGAALGFVLEGREGRVWFAGDTGLFGGMSDLGPLDAALIPVGGWGPTLGPEHLDPKGAVEATRRCGAPLVVPIHYGTFWPRGMELVRPKLFAPPGDDYARLAAAQGVGTQVSVLAHGGSVDVPVREGAA